MKPLASDRAYEPEKPASTPTKARPGSSEKVEAIAARLRRGEDLWHPQDETRPIPPRQQ